MVSCRFTPTSLLPTANPPTTIMSHCHSSRSHPLLTPSSSTSTTDLLLRTLPPFCAPFPPLPLLLLFRPNATGITTTLRPRTCRLTEPSSQQKNPHSASHQADPAGHLMQTCNHARMIAAHARHGLVRRHIRGRLHRVWAEEAAADEVEQRVVYGRDGEKLVQGQAAARSLPAETRVSWHM